MKRAVRQIRRGAPGRRAARVLVALALLAAGLAGLGESGRAQAAQGGDHVAMVVELDGAIDNVAARYLKRSLERGCS